MLVLLICLADSFTRNQVNFLLKQFRMEKTTFKANQGSRFSGRQVLEAVLGRLVLTDPGEKIYALLGFKNPTAFNLALHLGVSYLYDEFACPQIGQGETHLQTPLNHRQNFTSVMPG